MKRIKSIAFLNQKSKRYLLSASNLFRTGVGALFSLLLNYWLLHRQSLDLFNTYSNAMVWITLILSSINIAGKDFLIKSFSAKPSEIKSVWNSSNSIRILFLLPIICILFFTKESYYSFFFLTVLTSFRLIGATLEALTNFQKQHHFFALVESLFSLIFIAFLFLQVDLSPKVFLSIYLAFEGGKLLVAFIKHRESVFPWEFKIDTQTLIGAVPYFTLNLFSFLCNKADIYIVGFLINPEEMNKYYTLTNLISLSHIAYYSLNSVLESNILRLPKNDFDRFRRTNFLAGIIYSLVSTIGIYFISEFLYNLHWNTLLYILISINIVAFTGNISVMYQVSRLNQVSLFRNNILIGFLVNAISSLALIPNLGVNGALLGTTLAALTNISLTKLLIKKA